MHLSCQEAGDEVYQIPNKAIARIMFARHGKVWLQHSLQVQRELQQRAQLHIAKRQHEIREEYEGLLAEQELLLQKNTEGDEDEHLARCMSSAAFCDSDLAVCERLWQLEAFVKPSRVQDIRRYIDDAPPPLPEVTLPEGKRVAVCEEQKMPEWASQICEHRDFFTGTILVCPLEDGTVEHWLVVYCVQRPVYLAVCRCIEAEVWHHSTDQVGTLDEVCSQHVRYRFTVNYADMSTAADMPDVDFECMKVILCVKFIGGVHATSQLEPELVKWLLTGKTSHKASASDEAKQQPQPQDKEYEKIVLAMPWLQHLDQQQGFWAEVRKEDEKEKRLERAKEAVVHEYDEEELLAGLTAVDRARSAERELAVASGATDFMASENAGESTLLKKGIYHDAVQGKCISKIGRDFADRRGLQSTFKCTFRTHDEEPSRIMARAWAHRMQWFLNYELAHSAEGVVEFTDDIVSQYVEPHEFTLLDAAATKKCWAPKIAFIRRIPLSK